MMRRTWQLCVSVGVLAAGFVACSGQINDARRGGDFSEEPDPFFDNSFSCDRSRAPSPQKTRRLSKVEYENTLATLLHGRVNSGAADSIVTVLSPLVAAVPSDLHSEVGYLKHDVGVSQLHLTRYFAVAEEAARELTASPALLEEFAGAPCVASPDETCVRDFIRDLGLQTYRRPLTPEDVEFYYQIYAGSSVGLQDVISALLMSPHFLFHMEYEASTPGSGEVFALTPYETASRLSYHLWQTMPDNELFAAAADGRLATDAGYEQQVDRMLAHPAAVASMRGFFNEWQELEDTAAVNMTSAGLRSLAIEAGLDPDNLDALRESMKEEMAALTDYYTWDVDGRYSDLLLSNVSFATDPELAALYGVPAWSGDVGDLVSFPEGERAGMLTRGQALFSGNWRTSLIKNGVFVLNRVLCADLAPPADTNPPPGVNVEDDFTTRQVVAEITEQSGTSCQGCHARTINPLGAPFEQYDPFGRLRDEEVIFYPEGSAQAGEVLTRRPIDATASVELDSTELPVTVTGGVELSQAIVDSYRGHACFARHFWRFANARMENLDADGCALQAMYEGLSESRGGILPMIKASVMHEHFRQKVTFQD